MDEMDWMMPERITEIINADECTYRGQVDVRVSALEHRVDAISKDLNECIIDHAQLKSNITTILSQQSQVSDDIKELRTSMMDLITKTLEKSQNDMVALMQIAEKHRQEQEKSITSRQAESEEKDKMFYRKVIIACISIFGTIVLSFFGIKSVVPLLLN